MDDWFDHILRNVRTQPETPAVVMEDRVVTYGMLGAAINSCARQINALKFTQSDIVAVCVNDPIRHLTLGLAFFRVGIFSISIETGHRNVPGLAFTAMVGDASAKQVFDAGHRFVEVTDAWFAPDPSGRREILPEPFSGARQVCRRSLTSGSTGEPKIIGNTIEYIGRHVFPGIGVFNCNLVLSMPGLTSIFGFMVACAVLASRKTLCFAVSPFQAVRMIELFSIDFILAAPDQLVSIVRAARKSGANCRSLRTIAIGGSIPTRALLESAATHLCKDIRCRYGTSEVGLIAETTASEVLVKPGFVGYVQPGFEVSVFTASGVLCAPDEVGTVKSRMKRDDGSQPDPWTDHGDLGWVGADGEIYIIGRSADGIGLTGELVRDVSPVHEVEHLLRLEWDAADAAAIMVDDHPQAASSPEIWVGTVDCKDARADQLERILRRHGIAARLRLFALTAIPRGANGKIQRGQLRDMMLRAPPKAS